MKRILLFILPILIIVAIVFTIFGIMQVRFAEERLMDDLKRKAKAVVEFLMLLPYIFSTHLIFKIDWARA